MCAFQQIPLFSALECDLSQQKEHHLELHSATCSAERCQEVSPTSPAPGETHSAQDTDDSDRSCSKGAFTILLRLDLPNLQGHVIQ